jgi:hypothetical protein
MCCRNLLDQTPKRNHKGGPLLAEKAYTGFSNFLSLFGRLFQLFYIRPMGNPYTLPRKISLARTGFGRRRACMRHVRHFARIRFAGTHMRSKLLRKTRSTISSFILLKMSPHWVEIEVRVAANFATGKIDAYRKCFHL